MGAWRLLKLIESRKQNTLEIYNLTFHNFSTHEQLSLPKYRKVLGLGLKYIPGPRKHQKEEVENAFKNFMRSLKLSTYFPEDSNDVPFNLPTRLMKPSTWTPHLKPDHDIHNFERVLQKSIYNSVDIPNSGGKVDKATYDTLEELQKFDDVIFRPADKNLGITALNLDDYIKMAMVHLDDENYYVRYEGNAEELWSSLKMKTKRFHLWLSNLTLTPHQKKFIDRATEPKRFPSFNIMPKVHKRDLSSRPIVGAYEWFTTHGSVILGEMLEPYTKRFPQILRDSKDLADSLDEIRQINPDWTLVSFDVVALYPNISRSILGQTLYKISGNSTLTEICVFILSNTFFEFNDIVYKQIDGLPMGTNAAVHLANIFLAVNLDPFFQNIETIHCMKRYIDDYFMFYSGDDLDKIHEAANVIVPKIKLTKVESKTNIDVLDLTIKKSVFGTITYETFTKSMNKFQYIPPSSTHPPAVFKGFIKAELQRFARTNSLRETYVKQKTLFAQRLMRRGYSRNFLRNIFNGHCWKDRFIQNKKKNGKIVPFKIEWRNTTTDLHIQKIIRKCNSYDFIRKKNLRTLLCWKKARTLGSYLRMSVSSKPKERI